MEPEEIVEKTNLSAPHTVHCLADGHVMISMLGDGEGNGPGGFLLLDQDFNVAGRWENGMDGMDYNYDFWYQPRHNVMVSSEWAAPNTYYGGFNPTEVAEGKYGRKLHFWDWQRREISESIDLGEDGLIPLEVRFHHDPESTHGYVGAALSSNLIHWHKAPDNGGWNVEKVVDVPAEDVEGWPMPIPGLITDLLISLDDRYLYFSNLAARRPPPVRHLRPREPPAHRPGLVRRPARQGRKNERPQAGGRPADAPAIPRRQASVRDKLAV